MVQLNVSIVVFYYPQVNYNHYSSILSPLGCNRTTTGWTGKLPMHSTFQILAPYVTQSPIKGEIHIEIKLSNPETQ